jgi:phenylalanyl-tRNA synthetase beta chain
MKALLSWIKEFVNVTIPIPELAERLTLAGLEVEGVLVVGLPMPEGRLSEYKIHGLSWDPEKIVTASVSEVMPHPNADRLVLCRLYDGVQEHIVLTGAPNLYPYKGLGPLDKPLKVPYAREGARIYDGHQDGQVLTTLKRAKIRGVDSYSMICSEKELGISDEHEGVIILDEDAPVGIPLAEYMGDAVFEINIIPNVARAASMLGVAREVAALTGQSLRPPSYDFLAQGPAIEGKAKIEILNPELNPRFVLGLISDIEIRPSPYWVQRRLRLAGMRPINNIVDATNYVMLEIGQPLHAFDYDVLVQRAGGKTPTIITRTAEPGERLTTLDGIERELAEYNVLVCDTAGALSIAGVMGGAESEVNASTRRVLLEGAAWNFINIRRTATAHKLMSEAAYRFSRGVHPAMAERGVRRGLELMRRITEQTRRITEQMRTLSGGVVSQGLVDNYPLPPEDPLVEVTPADTQRWLGIRLEAGQIAELLERLEFSVQIQGETVLARTPDHRLDIGVGAPEAAGIIGKADLMEEVARLYGYDRIPETVLASSIPPENPDHSLWQEERMRDLLVRLGLQEVATYRMTSPERESKRFPEGAETDPYPYVRLANPIVIDRTVMRHSLLASLLEVVERNARMRPRIGLFELGPVYLASEEGVLPDEPLRLGIVLSGPRSLPSWQQADTAPMDFYDLKGILEQFLDGLHLENVAWQTAGHPSYHPGKCARILVGVRQEGDRQVGVAGELHPLVRKNYDLPETPLLAAEFDVSAILQTIPESYRVETVPAFPPVLEDLAIVVDESVPAGAVETVIRQAGGKLLADVRLFDVYRSPALGAGRKSLAYSLAYQAPDRTLQDKDAQKLRQRILQALEREVGAKLRG